MTKTYSIQDFLTIKTASPASFSHDGARVLIQSNLPGTSQIYRVPRAGGDLVQLTDGAEPAHGTYMPATDEILVESDVGGNERFQIALMDGDGQNLRPVVHDPDHRHHVGDVTRDGKTLVYTTNRRNQVDFDVVVRDLASGEERTVFDGGGYCAFSRFSPDGRFVTFMRPGDVTGDNQLFLADLATEELTEILPHDEPSFLGTPRWLPDGSAFFFATDLGREFACIGRYDIRSATWTPVVEREWDLRCAIDDAGRRLVVGANEDGYETVTFHDPATLARTGGLPLPRPGIASVAEPSRDGRYVAYAFVSPVDHGDAWLYDTETGATTRLTTSPNPVPADVMVEPELHHVPSFDGERIPLFVYRPRASDGPAPVVVWIHGGPEGQSRPSFNPIIQYLVHRGYGIVVPNVRGSTGYGKRFHHLDDRHKRLDSVRDLEAVHGFLRAQPGLDERRAALVGGSYGGYMVLAGLAFQPELWAAGIDIVGISNLVTFLENTSAYRRRFREREYGFLDTDREFMLEASPLTHVDRMRAPLFIIHGTNDPRVPLGEAEQIHAALKQKGIATELLVYPDEGHGLQKLRNRLDAYPKAVDFLDRVLGVAR